MNKLVTLILLTGSLTLSGCAQQSTSQQSQYYLLSSDSQSYTKSDTRSVIGVSPVNVAAYINTPGIALLTKENHIRIANHHLWAEQPDLAISRVLHSELDTLLPHSRVDSGELGRQSDWQYTITTQIDQFHGTASGEAVLSGFWQFKNEQRVLVTQRFNMKQPIGKPGYAPLVDSLRELLTQLAEQQAQEIAKKL